KRLRAFLPYEIDGQARLIVGLETAGANRFRSIAEIERIVVLMSHIVRRPIIETAPAGGCHEPRTGRAVQLPFADISGSVPRALELAGHRIIFARKQRLGAW